MAKQLKCGSPARSRRSKTSDYDRVLTGVVELLESARRASARAVNSVMTATYWEIGRRIVEHEQAGRNRADYGKRLLERLSETLVTRFGRGFGVVQLSLMRQFFLTFPKVKNFQSVIENSGSGETEAEKDSIFQSANEKFGLKSAGAEMLESAYLRQLRRISQAFPLPWTHYVRLLRVRNELAREFYTREALTSGWSVRQLNRQINSQFYERAALSRNKAQMLIKGAKPKPHDAVSADDEVRNPLVLEFLNLKDEYSENDLEEALIHHLEGFLLELGDDFAFVARQRRLRIGHEWFRVDLLFFHRRLRSLVIIDLKIGGLSHEDIGQMNLYCNYAREHWVKPGEPPPVGLILCTDKDDALARYALEGLHNKMLIREYLTALPKESALAKEIARTRQTLEARAEMRGQKLPR